MHLISINKKPYAVGLLWSLSDSKLNAPNIRKKIADDAEKIDPAFDLVAFRQVQYGLGASGGDKTSWLKSRSLAASIKVAVPSFLGLFYLEDVSGESLWWICAIKNGIISAQSDIVFSTRVEAEDHILILKDLLGDFDVIVCETLEESLNWLVPLLRGQGGIKYARLVELRPPPGKNRKILYLALLFFIGCGGVWGAIKFFENQEMMRTLEEKRIALMDKERHLQKLKENPEQYFPPEWASLPLASDVATVCMKSILTVPLAANGWEMKSVMCTPNGARVLWQHSIGADYINLPFSGSLRSVQEASSSLPVKVDTTQRNDGNYRQLLTQEIVQGILYQLTQNIGSKLRFEMTQLEIIEVEGVELESPWQKGSWELSDLPRSLVLDDSLFAVLAQIPGLTLESINNVQDVWSIRGALYVQAKK